MQRLVLLLATVALMSHSQISCRAANIKRQFKMLPVDITDGNSVEDEASTPKSTIIINFVRIKQKPPPSIEHVAGKVLELTCIAIGSPPPSIQWYRNNEPIADHDLSSNEIIKSSSSSIAQVAGTLLVATPSHNVIDVYTCLMTAGRLTKMASTTVYNIELNSILTERSKHSHIMAPKIVGSYEVYVDTIGQSSIIPCRVKGHPRPLVTWFDNNGTLIKNRTRMKVLKTGELSISKLKWTDMGDFMCQATNQFGSSSINTFVYPYKDADALYDDDDDDDPLIQRIQSDISIK